MINRVRQAEDRVAIRNALVSVADKAGLEELVEGLLASSPEIRLYSTGGTHQRIAEILGDRAADHLTSVSDYTGQPEMQGGLVKTLDFKIYLGLLSESDNAEHRRDIERAGAETFDLVVVNLYPFERAVANPEASCEDARAHIDIGGPTMLRAAAKNYLRVALLTDPAQYAGFLTAIGEHGGATNLRQRFDLARAGFAHVAHYDAAISDYLEKLDPAEVEQTYGVVQ